MNELKQFNKHFNILIETFQNLESNLKKLPNFWGNHIVNYHKKSISMKFTCQNETFFNGMKRFYYKLGN